MYRYLVLAVYASLDLPILDERNDLPFDLLNAPTKRQCHAVQTDRLKRLEIKYDGGVPQMLGDIFHVDSKMYVYVMSCLFHTSEVLERFKIKRRSHRISIEDVEGCFEIARHVGLYDVPDVRFLLNVCGEDGVLEELGFNGRAGQAGKRRERAVDSDIAWSHELRSRSPVKSPTHHQDSSTHLADPIAELIWGAESQEQRSCLFVVALSEMRQRHGEIEF